MAALLSSRLLLRKKVSRAKWLSVLLLTIGVVLVQLSINEPEPSDEGAGKEEGGESGAGAAGPSSSAAPAGEAGSSSGAGSSGGAEEAPPKRNRMLGLVAVLVACACSGLAGAVMEALLKGSDLPLSQRNLQARTPSPSP